VSGDWDSLLAIMSVQQRKDEILAKKVKLAELRRTRELRDKERSSRESGIGVASDVRSMTILIGHLQSTMLI